MDYLSFQNKFIFKKWMLTELLMGRLVCISNRQISRGTRRKSDRVTKFVFFFLIFNGKTFVVIFSSKKKKRLCRRCHGTSFKKIFFPSSFFLMCLFVPLFIRCTISIHLPRSPLSPGPCDRDRDFHHPVSLVTISSCYIFPYSAAVQPVGMWWAHFLHYLQLDLCAHHHHII